MPDNGDENIPIKTTFTGPQVSFLDKIVDDGKALNRPDAVRYIIVRAMEQKEQKAEG